MSAKPRVHRYIMPNIGSQEQRITATLYMLEMDGIIPVFKPLAQEALQKHLIYLDFLESLLDAQIAYKEDKRLESQNVQAKFPLKKTIEDYDFSKPHKIDEARVRELASCRFIDEGENVMFLGPTGVGKTHLAVGLSKKGIDNGKKVKFYRLNHFIEKLEKNVTNELGQQRSFINSIINLDLLVLDDMEQAQIPSTIKDTLYGIIIDRIEKGRSNIFTANESFANWGLIFGSQIRAEKISDRVHGHGYTIIIEGDSQRIQDKLKKIKNKAALKLPSA
ncbi:ATP-binding protein [Candidatus Daviesbacteria bacterium]|nr:ATP-binding protein [Candidatus Daviesbacteria bacterium]